MSWLRPRRAADASRARARQILVDSRTPLNYHMVAPIVRAMADDERVRFAFTASEEPQALDRIYGEAPSSSRLIGPHRAAFLKWDTYLTSDFMWATLPRGTARVQTFHGVAGKYGFDAPAESMRQWHRLFFINERRLRNFVACGAIDEGSPAARLIGMPKVDALVDGTLRRDAVLFDLGLDPHRPTVLYAPTWSPASSLNRLGVALVERLAAMPVNLIVKLHDRSRDPQLRYSGGDDWVGRLTPLLARPQTRLFSRGNIAPCLAVADVMITDHSSAGFEYLLLDRPLVRIESPELVKQARIHPDYVQLLADASDSVTTVEQVVAAVERGISDPKALSDSRRRIAADLFYQPGTATARATAALYELLELSPPLRTAAIPASPGTEACAQPA